MICARCSAEKAGTEFYAKDRTCKECRKAMARANRAANLDRYQAYDRERANRPDRVAARAAYQKSDAFKLRRPIILSRYWARNPLRRKANIAVGIALRDGKLERLACQVCGHHETEGHHADYSNALGVTWLCVEHHNQLHVEHREYLRETGQLDHTQA